MNNSLHQLTATCPTQRSILLAILLVSISSGVSGQSTGSPDRQAQGTALNEYYRFPVSAAASYQPLSGMGNADLAKFSINEISGELRLPLPGLPVLQPLVRGGLITYSYLVQEGDLGENVGYQDWTHYHVYLAPGVGYSTRISREVEMGADLFAGLSQSYFNSLVFNGQAEDMGQLNLVAGIAGKLYLNPSYNMSISVTPALRYIGALGELHAYDGLVFGVGFSASYRFGQDPDAAQSAIRAIKFGNIILPPLFAAMRSYYATKPVGEFTITNIEKYPIDEISVSFMQPGFMDSATPLLQGASLGPGESLDLSFKATFNDQVFSTEGLTPLTGEINIQYRAKGRSVEQKQSVSYELHDKNAITWDDDRKVAAFITPQDSAIRNYASFISQAHRDLVRPGLPKNLQFAMQVFNALGEIGILYQVDPTAPFTMMQGNVLAVDSISLPRETLKRLTGDCDDLTALFCTILETVGVETALVTTPAHIFCAFNTGVASADYRTISPDRKKFIESNGELWLPVEITLIGISDFFKAWETGLSEFNEQVDHPNLRGFYKTNEAQAIYRSVSLRETDLGLQYGNESAITARFVQDLERLSTDTLKPYLETATAQKTAGAWNSYGVAAARLGDYAQARSGFENALKVDPANLNAQFNLASVFTLIKDYSAALKLYQKLEKQIADPASGSTPTNRFKLYINLAKTYYQLGTMAAAKDAYVKAKALDPQQAEADAYLEGGSKPGS